MALRHGPGLALDANTTRDANVITAPELSRSTAPNAYDAILQDTLWH